MCPIDISIISELGSVEYEYSAPISSSCSTSKVEPCDFKDVLKNTSPSKIPQGTVKLDGSLNKTLDDWLKTEYAISLGFHSKAHFITQAVRELLFKYYGPHFTDLKRQPNFYEIFDIHTKEKVKIAINKSESALECTSCKSFTCDHIFFIWSSRIENSFLESLKFLDPLKHLPSNTA